MKSASSVSLMYELSGRCNQRCLFCYNSWKSPEAVPKRELGTAEVKALLDRVIGESRCGTISLSGGEPFMRDDLFEIASFIKSRGVRVSIVTNGTLLDEAAADRCVEAKIDLVQVSLLGDRPEIHNRLVGYDGFDGAIDAIIALRERKVPVATYFPALAENVERFPRTLELNVLLGVERVAIGRFTPGGEGLAGWERLMPSPEAMDAALEAAEEMSGKYRLAVSAAMPMLPCLHDLARFPRVSFGFCSVGRCDETFFAIDPEGNLKPCSHSPRLLGDLRDHSFVELSRDPHLDEFTGALPEFCRECADAELCRGGCRSSAHVSGGSLAAEDPYLTMWKAKARKPRTPTFVASAGRSD